MVNEWIPEGTSEWVSCLLFRMSPERRVWPTYSLLKGHINHAVSWDIWRGGESSRASWRRGRLYCALKQRWDRVAFQVGTSVESSVFAGSGARCHRHLPWGGTTQACWIDRCLPTWPGALAGACSCIQLWQQMVPLHQPRMPTCPPARPGLPPFSLSAEDELHQALLSTQHKPFPCRAKAYDSLQQYFIIYIFD